MLKYKKKKILENDSRVPLLHGSIFISYPLFADADIGIYPHAVSQYHAAEGQAWYCDAKCG